MKTASWSLAFAAGAVASAPPAYGDGSSAPPAYGSSSEAAPASSGPAVYSSVYASSGPAVYSSVYASSSIAVYPSSSAYALSSSASASGPVCTTTYVSTCEETSTHIYRDSTEYEPYTVSHTVTSTMDGECPTAPAYPSGSETAPVTTGGKPTKVVVTNTVTNTKYVCPCDTTDEPTRTPGEVYTTHYTTEYETTCPGSDPTEATFTYGDWTSIYTSYSLTTATETITATVTHPSYPTTTAETEPAGYPSESPSGTLPPYPSSGYAHPTGTGYPSPTGTGACVPCEGQPGNDPEKWCGYTINDNWYDVTPKTCKTREFFWTITNETISPDGVPRIGLVVQGQMPGPLLEANWGDEIVVHLTNGLDVTGLNGTSLHFHGIRQNHTNEMDGVSSITQCPIAPGHSMTYRWTASSYGSSWWHSHYALQLYEGVWGPMIIHGPASAEYDDEQFIALQDWNHIPVNVLYEPAEQVSNPQRGPPPLDTGLINGLNVWEGAGSRFEMTVTSGKSYRLRVLNSAIQSTFVFYVDQHELEVIAMDFVPITPYTTNMIVINIGQRYDVILKANQPSGDYWMRSDNQQPCAQLVNPTDIKGIVHYADGPNGEPTSQPYGYAPTCLDEPLEKLQPIVPWSGGAADSTINEAAVIGPYPGTSVFKWTLSGTTFFAEWSAPTLKQIYEDGTVPDTSGNLAIEIPNLGEWVYIIIQTPIPLPHPIHLHGHDFLILAQGLGAYSESVALNLNNPPRRDTAVMPADPTTGQPGYLVLAFYTSNPGVWLLHCHIGWHNAMGFALQIIENLEGIADTITNGGQIEDTCSAWIEYQTAYNFVEHDSGI